MKNIVATILVVGAALGFASVSLGQQAGPQGGAPALSHGPRRGNPMRMFKLNEQILSKLNLDQPQKEQVKALTAKTIAALKEMHAQAKAAGATVDKTQMRAKMKELRKGYHDSLFQILNPAQRKAYATAMKVEMMKMRQLRGNGKNPPPSA